MIKDEIEKFNLFKRIEHIKDNILVSFKTVEAKFFKKNQTMRN
jgi:hypothetical protein